MSRMQKHERETVNLLREHGFACEIKRTTKGHSDIFVGRGGVVRRIKLASSPAIKATYPLLMLKRCERLFKEDA